MAVVDQDVHLQRMEKMVVQVVVEQVDNLEEQEIHLQLLLYKELMVETQVDLILLAVEAVELLEQDQPLLVDQVEVLVALVELVQQVKLMQPQLQELAVAAVAVVEMDHPDTITLAEVLDPAVAVQVVALDHSEQQEQLTLVVEAVAVDLIQEKMVKLEVLELL